MPRLRVGNGILRRRGIPRLYSGLRHRHHRPVGHQHLRPLGLQAPLGVEPEEAFVALGEEVGLRDVHRQTLRPHAQAQHPAELRRQLHHALEQQPVALLRRRARIVHIARTCTHTPLPAPLITNHCAHRPTEGIVDTIALFCHKTLYFKRLINSISYGEFFFNGEFFRIFRMLRRLITSE